MDVADRHFPEAKRAHKGKALRTSTGIDGIMSLGRYANALGTNAAQTDDPTTDRPIGPRRGLD